MNKTLWAGALLASTLLMPHPIQAERQLAFPGAEGYGRYVTGGRGGEVCYVTRLDDCSDQNLVPGTLRWAIKHNNGGRPRTILFATSGTIYLTSKLTFSYPNVSILGQTAPGGGVTITGYNMYISKNNVIVRHMRFRAGDIPNKSMTGLDLENADGVIIDHCSMTWSMEECLTAYDTDSTTVQWCIIGESLYNSKNAKGERAYATQWGGEHSSMLHTLITNSMSRSPRFNGVRNRSENKGDHDYKVDSEFANNVVFNWGKSGAQYGGEYDKNNVEAYSWQKNDPGYNRVFLLGNYYKPGPSTQKGASSSRYWCAPSSPYGEWYLEGNKFEVDGQWNPSGNPWKKAELDKVNADNLYGAKEGNASRGINLTGENVTKYVLTEMPYALSGYVVESADMAYDHVTHQAGASLPRLDEVDSRLLAEARGDVAPKYHGATMPGYLGIIDSPDDITLSYPDTYTVDGVTYHNTPKMFFKGTDKYFRDSDADGMPDGYEEEQGFDKNNAEDGAAMASNGYTNLENYLNAVADGLISPSAYCTSLDFIEPGPEVEPQEQITYTFTKGSTNAEGVAPAAVTLPYGTPLTIPANNCLYKEGYTLSNWSTGIVTLSPGEQLKDQKVDVTLTPSFAENKLNLADRTQEVAVTWNVSDVDLTGSGIFVTQANFAGANHDVKLSYQAGQVTVPSCQGAMLTVDGVSTAISGETYTFDATGAQRIQVTLPYVWNTPGRIYHEPAPLVGTDYELYYTTAETVSACDWITASYLGYTQYRTFYDPAVDDGETCTDGSAAHPYLYCVVFNGSDRTFEFYVKGTKQLRVFLCHQSSNPDCALVYVSSSDGEDVRTLKSTTAFQKQQPVNMDVKNLDPTKSYRIQLSSEEDYDWAIGAIKLYSDKQADLPTSGDASVAWDWAGTFSEEGVSQPAGLFVSTHASTNALEVTGTTTAWKKNFVGLQPANSDTSLETAPCVTFSIQPAAGVAFKPEHLAFTTVKQGTDMGRWTITLQQGNGAVHTIATELNPARNNEATWTTGDYALTDISTSNEELKLCFHLVNGNTAKVYGLADIKVSGVFEGSKPEVATYTFDATAQPSEAATIAWNPEGNAFEAGTLLSVEAKGKAGYYFQHWQNQTGAIVSEAPVFSFKITEDTQLTAVYKSQSDYADIFENCAPYDAAVSRVDELLVALDAAAKRQDLSARYRILLHNGTYDLGTVAKTAVPQHTSLIGESMEGVLVMNNPGQVSDYQNQTPVLFIDQNQNNVYMQDLTLRQARDWDTKKSKGQALALRQRGKQAVYKNVRLQGVQDTYYLNKADATAYFETCDISGEVDFIYGDGTVFFEQCTLRPLSSSAIITAPNTQAGYKGIVFNDCTIDGAAGYRLGRPWNDSPAATYLSTTMLALPHEAGWGGMTSGLVCRFHEFGSKDANGQLLDLSKRSLSACAAAPSSDACVIDEAQAAAYALDKIFAGWNPAALTQQLRVESAPTLSEGILTWEPVEDAIGYAIVKNGNILAITTECTYSLNASDLAGQFAIRAINEMGGMGEPSATMTSLGQLQHEGQSDAAIYDLQGRKLDRLAGEGIYIVGSDKRLVK